MLNLYRRRIGPNCPIYSDVRAAVFRTLASLRVDFDMAAQHVKEIDEAINELIAARRLEIIQIAQNGANPGPIKNLMEIQMAIDSLLRARKHEESL